MQHPLETAESTVQVFVICRVRLCCTAIAGLLGSEPELALVGTASPGDATAAVLDAAAPDVVLLEAGSSTALELAQHLIQQRPQMRVLGFGVEDVPGDVIACAQAGLWGYVPSSASVSDLVAAIHRVARGDTVCSPTMANQMFRYMRSSSLGGESSATGKVLTRRQQQIARLLGEGLSNKEIARRLALGNSTVKNHVHDILDRLQVSRRGEAAARLRRSSYPP